MRQRGIHKEKDILKSKNLFFYVQIGGWLCYFLIVSLIHMTMSRLYSPEYYIIELQESLIGFAVTYLMRKRIIHRRVLNQPVSAQVWQLLYFTVFYSFLFSVVYIIVHTLSGYYRLDFNYPLVTRWVVQWIFCFILILVWNLLYFSYHYVQKSNQEILDKVRLQNTVKDLQLNTIKAHVNPHFIFNALNSIRALVEEEPEKARVAITKLSNLLRSSMQAEKRTTTTLAEELELVKDYLSLESIRYEDRLQIQFHIAEAVMNQKIPPMTLQTLVENAIKHGISKQINGGLIEIEAFLLENSCYIIVRNTGKLQPQGEREGFGVKSTIDRLHLLFGEKALLHLMQQGDNVVVATMHIPLYIKA